VIATKWKLSDLSLNHVYSFSNEASSLIVPNSTYSSELAASATKSFVRGDFFDPAFPSSAKRTPHTNRVVLSQNMGLKKN